ncbi:MAG: hypothetical protein LBD33_02300, partial [Puniceicoccales bacterium]|nr:hypothetical protein [Puniceicoccales bacterium]
MNTPSLKSTGFGSSSRAVQSSARANVGEGDWLLQTAKWVTRTNKGETARESLFKDIRVLSARATEEVGAADPVGDADGPSKANKKLALALAYAKCSAAAKVNEGARKAMEALVDKVKGKAGVGIQGSGQNRKISYKNLQISVIEGPKHPEMSVSFSGGMDNAETADDQFGEFVGILHGAGGTLGEEDERRTVNLGDTAIGLPVERPFTGGMRFKILEPSEAGRERTVVLDSECMDALNTVLSGEVVGGNGFVQMRQLFQPKWNAYTQYKSAFEGAGEGAARHRETERRAAFAPNELARLIEFLQQRLKMNISPHTTVFSTTASGFSAAPEPHD